MKKKIVTLLLISTTLLYGCGNNSTTTSENSDSQENTEQISTNVQDSDEEHQEEVLSEETEEIQIDTQEAEDHEERSLSGIEQYMLDTGYLTGEKTQKYAEMLGAIDGFGYDCGVEIYQYDTSSDTYASVAAGEEIPLQGMDGYSVKFAAVNGEFALIFSNEEEPNQEIIDAFMEY